MGPSWFTIALVVVTGYYAIQTRKLAEFQKLSLEFDRIKFQAERQPAVFFSFQRINRRNHFAVRPIVTNVSSAPAKEIEMTLSGKETGHFGTWFVPTFIAREARELGISLSKVT